MKPALLLAFALSLTICSVAQTQKQRLIAQARYHDPGMPVVDSIQITYSGNAHSQFDQNCVCYVRTNGESLLYANGRYTSLLNVLMPLNNIDSSFRLTHITHDSIQFFSASAGLYSPLTPEHTEYCIYDSSGRLSEVTNLDIRSTQTYDTKTVLQDSSGQVVKVFLLVNQGGGFDTGLISYRAFSSAGLLLVDSGTTKWGQPQLRHIYNYASNGKCSTHVYQGFWLQTDG
jgi:hypothetical protein